MFSQLLQHSLRISLLAALILVGVRAHAEPYDDEVDNVVSGPLMILKLQFNHKTAPVAPPTITPPAPVAGEYYDATYRVMRPLRLRGEYFIHSAPGIQAPKIAVVRDRALSSNLLVTGREIAIPGAGKVTLWMEVVDDGRRAWMSSDALIDGAPRGLMKVAGTPRPSALQAVVLQPPPVPRPLTPPPPLRRPMPLRPQAPTDPATRPVLVTVDPPLTPLPPQAPAAKPHLGPVCVSTLNAFQRNDRFKKAMNGTNPFTRWNGPFNASIDVGETGASVLHHPINGDIRLTLSLCLDGAERPYIGGYGSPIYLQGNDFNMVQVPDPTSGNKYMFTRVVN